MITKINDESMFNISKGTAEVTPEIIDTVPKTKLVRVWEGEDGYYPTIEEIVYMKKVEI